METALRELPPVVAVDRHLSAGWTGELACFEDASIYQSAEYARARWHQTSISSLTVSAGEKCSAMALARILRFPFRLGGIAYVGWGPAYRRVGNGESTDSLRAIVKALRREFVQRRGFQLRIVPNIYGEKTHLAKPVFMEEGFSWSSRADSTILLDLSPTILELRSQIRRSWRQVLNKAEKANLTIVQGTDVRLYDEALEVYRQMHARKQFAEFVDKHQFRQMQQMLPDALKMQILLVRESAATIAAIAWSAVGATGLPLLAATGERALATGAGNLMWWRMIEWMKLHGLRHCDLGGVDKDQNPGGYTFKTGLAGPNATVLPSLGEFSACEKKIGDALVQAGTVARNSIRRLRLLIENLQQKRRAAAQRTSKKQVLPV